MGEHKAFTIRYNKLVNELRTEVALLDDNGNEIRKLMAIWDTGATNSVLRASLASDLKLPVISYVEQSTANGKCTVPVYMSHIRLPNNVQCDVTVTGSNISDNIDMLIGMDIIGRGDFTVTNANGQTVLSFVFPSLGTVDYISVLKNLKQKMSKNVGRNDPCPCGSGKKYKNCHGKN